MYEMKHVFQFQLSRSIDYNDKYVILLDVLGVSLQLDRDPLDLMGRVRLFSS